MSKNFGLPFFTYVSFLGSISGVFFCLFLVNIEAVTNDKDGVTSNKNYNPDVDLSTLDIIRKAGYPAEAHIVLTDDGYLLTIHRIPGSLKSSPVFLQHGLLGSSSDWIITGKLKALAFILADLGYDVWIGNFRGNTYSRAHIKWSISDSRFWDFSWHEMGIYDLPAMILYITNIKQSNLIYIGHSMGTTAFYVMSSLRQDIAKKVNAMFSLAPVAFIDHLKSPLRFLAPFVNSFESIIHFLGKDEFLPQNSVVKFLSRYACDLNLLEEEVCSNILFLICGFDQSQFNETLLPAILSHSPAGTSTKVIVHYTQEVLSRKFCQFDHGSEKNKRIYNNTNPPEYDLSKISVPISLSYSSNDWLASVIDVGRLSSQLNTVFDRYEVPYPKFNHIDFLWAINAPDLVYNRMIPLMQKYS